MAARFLAILLIVLGLSAILIGLSIYLTGAPHTGEITTQLYDRLTGISHGSAPLDGPTVDSELRFYAPLWIAYGAMLIVTASKLKLYLNRVPLLSAVFFAGGVGRGLAYLFTGPPHPAFVVLMVTEFVLPVIFIGLWAVARGSHSSPRT
jgi:Domain of unknown function (DUF4345)